MSEVDPSTPPPWDDAAAQELIGCTVIIGLTYRSPGNEDRQEQMHGVITAADARDGIEVTLSGSREGEAYVLPPHLAAFERARPGSYRLRSTAETIEDPDYVTTWVSETPAD